MRTIQILFALAVLDGVVGCGLSVDSLAISKEGGGPGPGAVFEGPVPKANCGPGSQPELGMQGEPRAGVEARCNLEMIGRYEHGEGANWQFAWYDKCGYYGTDVGTFVSATGEARRTEKGAVVVDVSDPTNPVETAVLSTPAVLNPHESLKMNEKRGLLAAVQNTGPSFDIYDVTGDCAHPTQKASVQFPETAGHEGEWAPDGLTYYGSDNTASTYYPIDVTDPAKPELLMVWPNAISGLTHGLSLSDDGTRGYFATIGNVTPNDFNPNGLVITDTSEVQSRRPDMDISVIGTLFWTDGSAAQHTIPVTIQGKPYVIFIDEGGGGAARIIDISDERNPFVVSKLKLETSMLGLILGVGNAHYCSVPQRLEPEIVACAYETSGIRVFDIRDPYAPKEIAYFTPAAVPGKPLPGSSIPAGQVEWCTAQIRIIKERGELWTTCWSNEFIVLKFTNGVWPFAN